MKRILYDVNLDFYLRWIILYPPSFNNLILKATTVTCAIKYRQIKANYLLFNLAIEWNNPTSKIFLIY